MGGIDCCTCMYISQLLWQQYEGGVKEVLGWISDEAGKFSKEVTVWGGEKGVADHMETCKVHTS